MIKETSIHFGLEDVLTIRLHCGNCPNEIILHPGEQCMAMPDRCANCGTSWIQGNKQTDKTRQLIYLLSYISNEVTDPAVKIQLELRDD